jgi:hypothetical protein
VGINEAVRRELRAIGALSGTDHELSILVPRSDLTSADRIWSAHYQSGDGLYYSKGSRQLGIEPSSYTTVVAVEQKANQLTVQDSSGRQITYDPKRLQGITAYQETTLSFSFK